MAGTPSLTIRRAKRNQDNSFEMDGATTRLELATSGRTTPLDAEYTIVKRRSMLEEIKHLVLEAGGTRCAWQAGFLSVLQQKSALKPDVIWAVSASSAVACAMASGRLESAIQIFRSGIAGNEKNIYLSHLFKKRPIFPQATIYREGLLQAFNQEAIAALRSGPEIQVLITRTWPSLPGYVGVFAGLAIDGLRRLSPRKPAAAPFARFGFSKEFISAKECRTPAELADLVLASSCTPPITPLYSFQGRTALDGGLMESIPLSGLAGQAGTALVLRTTRGKDVTPRPGLVFVEPSQEPRIASWDYTDPAAIDSLYDLGRRDAGDFMQHRAAGVDQVDGMVLANAGKPIFS
jgi:predicted acylesterase/phospholipase RssA